MAKKRKPPKMKTPKHTSIPKAKYIFSKKFWKRRRVVTVIAVSMLFGVVGTLLLTQTPAAPTDDILFPADANIVNVKLAPYSAVGNGVADDSDKLLQAFLDNDYVDGTTNVAVDRGAPRTVYLPAGTYRVTKSLAVEGSTLRIVGAGKGKTIIKLDNNAVGFTNAASPKYLLETGTGTFTTSNLANSGFGNYVQNLTIDTGSGNPGASGVRYFVANHGAMQHVEIKSSDPNKVGKYGIGFITSAGPGLVQDVTITGFDYGVYLDDFTNNVLTFEDLTLNSQKLAGIHNVAKNIVLENLVSVDNPVTIETEQNSATVMMIGSTLDGNGTGPAINLPGKGFLYLRDITTTGYSNIVSIAGSNSFVGKSSLTEWSSENYREGNTIKSWTENNAYVGLHLPIKKSPDYYSNDFSTWANVQTQTPAATAGTSSADAANSNDDGPAIQAAIDSGAETIYFPYGYYTVRSPVHIRGNVKRIDFMHSFISGVNGGGGSQTNFIVDGVNGDTVVIENAATNMHIQQNSSDTVVVRNMKGGDFDTGTNASGDLFVENTGAHTDFNITEPINVWARSMDRTNADWINSGGTLWVLSNNIESDMTRTDTTNGGKTEIIGGTADNLGQIHTTAEGPVFSSIDSFMSVFSPGAFRTNSTTGEMARWDYFLHDDPVTGVTTDLYAADKIALVDNPTNQKFVLPMFVTPGYTHPPITPPPPPPPTPTSYEIGTATLVSNSASDCPSGAICQTISVSCSGLQQVETASIAEYGSTSGTTRGVLVSFIGLEGHGFSMTPNQQPLNGQLRADGFKIIDISWTTGWAYSAAGEDAGSGHLACRSAAAIKWTYDNKYVPLGIAVTKIGQCGFCGIGHSGGSAQVTYSLAFYHLDNILNGAIVYGGPSHASLAQGCTATAGSPGSFGNSARSLIDASFGYIFPATNGPCYLHTASFTSRWDEESVETGGNDYAYPTTRVHLINGDQDSTMLPKGDAYIAKLQSSGSPYVTKQILAGVGHDVNGDVGGQAAIRAAILTDTGVLVGIPPTVNGDVNGDTHVNIFDLSILASNWGRSSMTRAQGDLNNDGVVNVFDLSILASNWGI